MNRIIRYLPLLLIFALFTGCEKDNPTPEPKPEVPSMEITIDAVSSTSVEFRVTPSDDDITYMVMMAPKGYLDEFTSDEAIIDDDLLWFESIAYEEGITIEEYLAKNLRKGTLKDKQGDLTPGSEYYIYAYGLDTKGVPTTALTKESFTTLEVEKNNRTFDIEVSNIGHSTVTVSIKPETDDFFYFVNVFSDEDVEYWGGKDVAYDNYVLYLRDYYLAMGATVEQIVANLAYVGDKSIEVNKLKPGTKYHAWAVEVNLEFLAASNSTTAAFETLEANSSDVVFDIRIEDVDYDRVSGSIYPSNDNDTYLCSIQSAEMLEWYTSDEKLMEAILEDINTWQGGIDKALRSGVTTFSTTGLTPNKEFVVLCFGYDGTVTTELYRAEFTTPDATGTADELSIEFEISDITHNSVKITTEPSVGHYYFVSYATYKDFAKRAASLGSNDAAIVAYCNEDIDYGAQYFGMSRGEYLYDIGACLGRYTTPFNQLESETEYIAFAIAVDVTTGEIASEHGFLSDRFTTTKKITGEAKVEFHFDKYYDGSELAELDPTKYLRCKGFVVVPYTITHNDAAKEWYTSYSVGDYTEWGCTDDDIYQQLITYGYEMNVEEVAVNSEGGIAVLNYDTAFTFLGMAKDENGHYGPGTLQIVSFSRDGVSPAEEMIN